MFVSAAVGLVQGGRTVQCAGSHGVASHAPALLAAASGPDAFCSPGYPLSCPVEDAVSIAQCSESSRSCVSVFNEDEAHFAEPWMYDGPREKALAKLRRLLASRGDVRVVEDAAERGYIYAEFAGKLGAVDDVEFYLPADDVVVLFRSSSRLERGGADQRQRMEELRIALGFEKLPVVLAWDPRWSSSAAAPWEQVFKPFEPLFKEISKTLY
eukprot:tig00000430_g642.t1